MCGMEGDGKAEKGDALGGRRGWCEERRKVRKIRKGAMMAKGGKRRPLQFPLRYVRCPVCGFYYLKTGQFEGVGWRVGQRCWDYSGGQAEPCRGRLVDEGD